MTITEAKHALCQRALGQVGYHEGANNYNKYAEDPRITRLFGWNVQNQPYCATFVHWVFINTFGYDEAVAMTYGGSAACWLDAEQYKNHGAFSQTPEVGSVIYLYVNGNINHEGIVVEVNGDAIVSVSGNYSDMVSKVTRYRNDPQIAGYGIPNWAVVANEPEPDEAEEGSDEETEDIIHPLHRRACYHLEYGDGLGNPLPQVKAWQNFLLCWGFDLGKSGADGEFGTLTMIATQKWQEKAKAIGCDVEVNGIVDSDDWEEIIKVPTEV